VTAVGRRNIRKTKKSPQKEKGRPSGQPIFVCLLTFEALKLRSFETLKLETCPYNSFAASLAK
jgi:hypothetical protein